ncbi:MAG: DUF3857 domain-containing protein [Calditrichaeota bacterium]|nr:DUF3857 domain-containing protein [Calditrichota bacterium]
MRYFKKSIFIVAVSIILQCAGSNRWGKVIEWKDVSLENLPSESDYPDQGAVILLDEGNLEIFKSSGFAYSLLERHRIVKIFNSRGVHFANVTIPYSSSTTVSNIKARTITGDGRIIPLPADQIFDVTLYPGFIFYSDIRAKRFTLPGVEDGCVVEYEWQKIVKNFTYWDQWTFQNEAPTLISRYHVKAPSEWEIKWKTRGIDLEPKTENLPDGFKQDYVWEAKDLPAMKREVAMPPPSRLSTAILFSPVGMTTWSDVATWYHELSADRIKPNEQIKTEAENLTRNCRTQREKLEKIYQFVRDKIRYVAISIGIGGYQPHFATDVLHNRYGDCKDKAALIAAMAKTLGIDVDLVLISTWQNGEVDTTITSHTQFNHVIACAHLNGRNVWMDATETFCPFGHLPWYDQGRLTFVIDHSGQGEWEMTAKENTPANVVERNWKLEIDSTGRILGELKTTAGGAYAMQYREEIETIPEEQIDSWIFAPVLQRFPKSKSLKVSLLNRKTLLKPLTFNVDFRTAPDSEQVSCLFTMDTFCQFDWYKIFVSPRRNYPVAFKFPSAFIDRIHIHFPDSWKIETNIINDSTSNSFGHEINKISITDNHEINIYREFYLKKTFIEPSEYQTFKTFLNDVALADRQFLLFKKF